ncbi:hypothetical protein HHL19_12855 [Streptomyces sp. R302]|uniref:hypothetical protein n=1 Tax=unclassified Streptomyces TaxID=2593676 RepID=UPI00145D86A2|nr:MULTISPECIES: hypothetical protein [unclassified Streptomyces]NML50550.1 hypothetical protein [Streptomyces sp. R301]NML79541.1 hypothetical protein [Streptomyces sp. R302]
MSNSTNHQVWAVLVVALASLVVGVLAVLGWVLLGGEPLASLAAGGAAFGGCFGIGLAVATFLRGQGS